MGRAERRLAAKNAAKLRSKELEVAREYYRAKANQTRLKDELIDQLDNDWKDINVAALYNALAYFLSKDDGWADTKIENLFIKVSDLVGKVGTEEIPTVSDLKIFCAKQHHMDIYLTDEEVKIVEAAINAEEEETENVHSS